VDYYKDKPLSDASARERIRQAESKHGQDPTMPPEEILLSKEEADRARYREMMESLDPLTTPKRGFEPVLTDRNLPTTTISFEPEEEDLPDGFLSRIGSLLQKSITGEVPTKQGGPSASLAFDSVDDQDLKGRYYYDKFQFSPFDADKHRALRKAYIEGLVWNLRYYFQGCASWSWYYPYHYGPMLSDLVRIPELLNEVDFEGEKAGKPLKPFEQLMGCMPPSSSGLLPEPYRWLMTDPTSPLAQFYPRSFIVDMNGKRWPWEATVLLPFLDSKRLLEVTNEHVQPYMLTDAENARNQEKKALVYSHDPSLKSFVPALPLAEEDYFLAFSSTATLQLHVMPNTRTVFEPKLLDGVQTPSPGFPSLTSAAIHSLWRRRIGTDVHGSRSRYRTALLQTSNRLPIMPSAEALAKVLIGTTVYINYPYLLEGFVTSLSNITMTLRGREAPHHHNETGREVWRHTLTALSKKTQLGEGIPGTGGWMLPESSSTICVRPLQGITTLPDGTKAKIYAKFEVTLPFMAALWSPLVPDPRTENLPMALEEDPFFLSTKGGDFEGTILPIPEPLAAVDKRAQGAFARNDSPPGTENQLLLSQLFPAKGSESEPPPFKRSFSTTRSFGLRDRQARPPGLPQTRSFLTMVHRSQPLTLASSRVQVKGRGVMGLGVAALVFLGGVVGETNANPNGLQPHGFLVGPQVVGDSLTNTPPLRFEHGTTTLSFVFQDGIVAAVDSRASLGNFVGSKTVQKVLPINSHMLGTMAGGAADCSFWIRKLKAEAELFELASGYRMSVARASRLLSNALYENRGSDLSVGTMIMGFDPDGGPRIYYVDDSGARIEGDMFSVGSGSTFALGILDRERRFDMTKEEAIALGIKAIRHATFRDAYSGGFINVFLITSDGWKKVFSEDIAGSAGIAQGESAETVVQEV
jgi:20S proteasome alpha/beta subunit